ncbi:MAG: hypothetical protein A2675_03320 [Candidatus Yonathbacteria bacterium RIFCSPHIGHO2_01_FULL_51_10]|uniref:Uncharacterized protein n=1 Tax=Candidatus Yonathbacteria bacterium RIFCSPHIGHO2_01_FULL_51_10 TaxID=1802723 RepID=A0A1G2S8S7_9BACT|nr:MAG: hypothetical protein A2675_03320 [Candidatus Yonathbacteria bacterium RIFCSPHIGHO2_01_FULL_51_10]
MTKNYFYMVVFVGVLAIFLGGTYLYQARSIGAKPDNINEQVYGTKTYRSEVFGFAFEYSDKYFLETREIGDGGEGHSVVSLTEDTEENRLVREGKSPGREGPVAITFDVYQSPDQPDSLDWVKKNPASNFEPLGRDITEVVVAGKPAISYHWSGLYEADAIAVANNDYMLVMTATYIFPEDEIRADFSETVNTVKFFPEATSNNPEELSEINLTAGINESTSGLGITIAPLEVVEDSRCPTDENIRCIQAGTVRVRTKVTDASGDRTLVFALGNSVTSSAETIELTSVLPEARAAIPIRLNEYRFVFKVTKE